MGDIKIEGPLYGHLIHPLYEAIVITSTGGHISWALLYLLCWTYNCVTHAFNNMQLLQGIDWKQ